MKDRPPPNASEYTKWLKEKANLELTIADARMRIPAYERHSIISQIPTSLSLTRVGLTLFKNSIYTPPPFAPSDIDGLSLWLDAFDTSTITISGSNLIGWRDKSSSARALTPSSLTAFQYANTFNGSLPSVFGPNTGGGANIASIAGFTLNNPATIFAVFRNTNQSRFPYIFGIGTSNRAYAYSNGSSPGRLHVAAGLGGDKPTGLLSTTNQIFTMTTGASSTLVYQNGGVNGAGSTVSPSTTITLNGASVTDTLIIGGSAEIEQWTGNFCEFIIYNSALSTAQRQQIEGYLAWKWGLQASLPSNHPYFNVKP